MARKRSTLPRDFDSTLETATLEQLKAVFDKCALDARGGYGKSTAIGFVDCPDELISWLVEQGLDVDAADTYGRTPLWERASLGRVSQIPLLLSFGANIEQADTYGNTPLAAAAGSQRPDSVRVLLAHGASVLALDDQGRTPLLRALARTRNADIPDTLKVARMLIEAGDVVTSEMRAEVERIGAEFEFHRAGFNPDSVAEVDAALADLYQLLGVTPAAQRVTHDGASPISVTSGSWPEQHRELWGLLVPSSGPALSVQGEVVRLTGRVGNEILGNGGANWDRDFAALLASIPALLATGTALPAADLAEAQELVHAMRKGNGDDAQVNRLCEFAVDWVLANPLPIELPPVNYRR